LRGGKKVSIQKKPNKKAMTVQEATACLVHARVDALLRSKALEFLLAHPPNDTREIFAVLAIVLQHLSQLVCSGVHVSFVIRLMNLVAQLACSVPQSSSSSSPPPIPMAHLQGAIRFICVRILLRPNEGKELIVTSTTGELREASARASLALLALPQAPSLCSPSSLGSDVARLVEFLERCARTTTAPSLQSLALALLTHLATDLRDPARIAVELARLDVARLGAHVLQSSIGADLLLQMSMYQCMLATMRAGADTKALNDTWVMRFLMPAWGGGGLQWGKREHRAPLIASLCIAQHVWRLHACADTPAMIRYFRKALDQIDCAPAQADLAEQVYACLAAILHHKQQQQQQQQQQAHAQATALLQQQHALADVLQKRLTTSYTLQLASLVAKIVSDMVTQNHHQHPQRAQWTAWLSSSTGATFSAACKAEQGLPMLRATSAILQTHIGLAPDRTLSTLTPRIGELILATGANIESRIIVLELCVVLARTTTRLAERAVPSRPPEDAPPATQEAWRLQSQKVRHALTERFRMMNAATAAEVPKKTPSAIVLGWMEHASADWPRCGVLFTHAMAFLYAIYQCESREIVARDIITPICACPVLLTALA